MKSTNQRALDYADLHHPNDSVTSFMSYRDGYVSGKIETHQRSIFWFCIGIVFTVLFCLIAGICFGQDSLRLTVTKARSDQDRTYYWFKDDNRNNYQTVCSCEQKHTKGDIVMIAKKDLLYYEEKRK